MRIGMIGLGFIALTEYLPALMQLKDIEIVCAIDPDEEKLRNAASKYNITKLSSSLDDLWEAEIDAALVLTPYQATYGIVRQLLERGIDVLSEKPMAEYLEHAEELVELAEKRKLIYMVGLNRRYAPSFLQAKQAFGPGEVEMISVEKVKHMTYYRDKPMMDFGIHALDTLLWLSGGRVATCSVDCTFGPDGRESSVQAQFGFDNGVKGRFMMSGSAGLWEESVRMFGQAKTVEIEAPSVLRIKSGGEVATRTFGLSGSGATAQSFGFRQQLQHFAECARTRTEPATTGRVALYTQQVMNMMYKRMHELKQTGG